MSRIVLSYFHYAVCGGKYYKQAFQDLGHEVYSVGPAMKGFIPWAPEKDFSQWEDKPHAELFFSEGDKPTPMGEYGVELAREIEDALHPDLMIQVDAHLAILGDFKCPNVCVSIDNHVRKYDLREYTHLFYAHSQGSKGLNPEKSSWLPCAYSKRHHKKLNDGDRYYNGLIIGVNYGNRMELVKRLGEKYDKVLGAAGFLFEEYESAYNGAKISIVASAHKDLAQRVFETQRMGCLVLADKVHDMEDLGLRDGENILTYESLDEADEKFGWAINNWDEAKLIAERGYAWAEPHSWEERAKVILKTVGL